ncbi:flagellar hook assembly protein FlgD [Ancylobacter lacus]|uniref:flagellar hook assembly protein FlgD n=1 Tax=Ancylobacter lacus TaxID=2579970 RepID=UPI001BCE4039|nr:flagellar hook assembly protein FlgD [Ancylobacter lacus]MBS7537961.1 flagellar hook assembly protein FlgD [Ancylobacter lacus]
MTSVSPLTSTSGPTSTSATKADTKADVKAASLDYTAFLRLLIAQMKNQDPTKPMDSTAYMSQLASFSQVEQSVSTNSKLDSLLTSSALQTADNAIGRNVTSADGTISGRVASVRITSEAPVATLTDGREVTLGAGVRLS